MIKVGTAGKKRIRLVPDDASRGHYGDSYLSLDEIQDFIRDLQDAFDTLEERNQETAAEMCKRLGFEEPTEEQKDANLTYNLMMLELDKMR